MYIYIYSIKNVYKMAASEFFISMSALVRSILCLLIVLDPLKQISADLNKLQYNCNFKENDNTLKFTKHVSTETSVIFS